MGKSVNVIAINDKKTQVIRYYIRTIENRKQHKKSLGIKLNYVNHKNYFNEKKQRFRVQQNFPQGALFNQKIDEELLKIETLNNDNFSIDINATGKQITFLKYFNMKIFQEINTGTKIKKQVVYNKVKKFINANNKEDVLFEEITHNYVADLFKHFKTVKNPKKLSHNSAVHYLMIIKSIINTAKKEGVYEYKRNPFSTLKLKKHKKKSVYLSVEEVEKITEASIEDKSLDEVRIFFLFQIFANGMRVSDLLKLRWGNIINQRVKYTMQKNSHEINISLNTYLCYLISILHTKMDNYEEIKEHTRVGINYEEIDNKKILRKIDKNFNLKELDFTINSRLGINITNNPFGQKLLKEIFEESLSDEDKLIQLHDYKVDENDKILIYLINQKQKLLIRINQEFQNLFFQKLSNYKKDKKAKFIFNFLNQDLFNEDEKMTSLLQYKHLKHKTIVIDRKLKKLQKILAIETNLTTHVARHTFSNLLLESGDASVFDISKMLGHSSLLITEIYLKENFDNNRLDVLSDTLQNRYALKNL
jgi:integrase